jgi:hypothetical protein
MRINLLALVFLVACDHHDTQLSDTPDGSQDAVCGGFAAGRCAATEYCDYANNQCGIADQTGTCKPRPEACPLIAGRPVCGCDGNAHASECAAYADGVDLNARGTCAAPSGWFECGYLQCNVMTQYCVHEPHTSPSETYTCAVLPACGSSPPTCACLASEPCGNTCSGVGTTGLTLTCP